MEMSVPITPIIDIVNSVICAFCSYKIYRSFQQDRANKVLKYFSQAYFALTIAFLFFSLPRLIAPTESVYLAVAFVLAQACMYLAISYFAKITMFFINIHWVQRVFSIVLLASVIAVVLSVVYFGQPRYDIATGITDWGIHPVVGISSMIIFGAVLLPSLLLIFRRGIKSKDRVVRTRSLLISIGLLLLIITAYTYYTATTQLTALVSDLFSLLSFLVIFAGVIYKRNSFNNVSINNNQPYAR